MQTQISNNLPDILQRINEEDSDVLNISNERSDKSQDQSNSKNQIIFIYIDQSNPSHLLSLIFEI